MQYRRNDINLVRGTFRVRGDTLEFVGVDEELVHRIEFFGDEIESINVVNMLTGEYVESQGRATRSSRPSTSSRPTRSCGARSTSIEAELVERLAYFRENGKLLEAQRLEMRTRYDLDMLREVGYCNGIENYSRHLDRARGRLDALVPARLLPEGLAAVRRRVARDDPAGPRHVRRRPFAQGSSWSSTASGLPSALDNRPLTFDEFERAHLNQAVYVSATPATVRTARQSAQVVEMIIRPTGLVDPEVEVRPTRHQVDDLMEEIRLRAERNERVLVTTLTKKMAEDLTDFLLEMGIRVRYLHSEIETLERIAILRDLRKGVFDVLVGINLLREGLDLPEVSLVGILDADKEGYLRSGTSLIQTIGRAARNVEGKVIMYADVVTESMARAIGETQRRRDRQIAFNPEHGIEPRSIRKQVRDILDLIGAPDEGAAAAAARARSCRATSRWRWRTTSRSRCAKPPANLEFEKAAALRDELLELRVRLAATRACSSRGRRRRCFATR